MIYFYNIYGGFVTKIKIPPFYLLNNIMRTLTEYIKEQIQECGCCGECAATPANTVGMGNVEPLSTDPVPTNTNILKKKKNRRRRIIKRQ